MIINKPLPDGIRVECDTCHRTTNQAIEIFFDGYWVYHCHPCWTHRKINQRTIQPTQPMQVGEV